MNKQQLASKIWAAANRMRSKISANEYKDYILGFMFYKFLSDKEEKWLYENEYTKDDIKEYLNEDNPDVFEHVLNNLGYFISYNNLFSTWLNMGTDFNVANVRDALSAFSTIINNTTQNTNYNAHSRKVFHKIFDTLETGLSKLGDTAASQTKAIKGLLDLINVIPMNGKQDYDVLGFVYEYLISQFAANSGKAGEFYTPHEVAVFMAELVAHHLKDRDSITIYDSTSGSGSLLINIGNAVKRYMHDDNKIKYYAQELIESTFNLTRMNLIMRGVQPDNMVVRNGDTLDEDWPFFEDENKDLSYHLMAVDAVVSNPPYSQNWDPKNKDTDPRYKSYGVAPKSKADLAFLLHDLYHINNDGILCIVMPHGVLFRGNKDDNGEGKIRKNLIEYNKIEAIIGLPANIFFGTGIPTIIVVLKHKREDTDVLIVDGSKGFVKDGKKNKLRACDVKKLVDTVTKRRTIPGYSRLVSKEEIRNNDYNLNIPRYVDSSEKQEEWDIYATMFGGMPPAEVDAFSNVWDELSSLKDDVLQQNNQGYYVLKDGEVIDNVLANDDVKQFIDDFSADFADFPEYLERHLIGNIQLMEPNKEEYTLSDDIFYRLHSFPLLDKYAAYQILDDQWKVISADVETMQRDGFEAVRMVDPKMVMKKKDDEEIEVQEGYEGRIIPFALIWQTLLAEDYSNYEKKKQEIDEIHGQWQNILEEMSVEEKDVPVWKDEEQSSLDSKVFAAYVKSLKATVKKEGKFGNDTAEHKWLQVSELIAKEKATKKEALKLYVELQEKTIETIKNLEDEQAKELLRKKWIVPLVEGIMAMPRQFIEDFADKLTKLSQKYAVTLSDLEKDIARTSDELASMLDELTGNEKDMQGLAEFRKLLKGC